MKIIKKTFNRIIGFAVKLATGDLSQKLNTASGEKLEFKETDSLIRQSAGEGCVLLKNNGSLPIKDNDNLAVFGRCQYDYFYVGYGSGGDVCAPYKVNLIDGIKNNGINYDKALADIYSTWCKKPSNKPDEGYWGNWPFSYDEMPITNDLAKEYSKKCNKALYVIGRAAGEERENQLKQGSYYLTDIEKHNIDTICNNFDNVIIVLDCGNIIDMAWTEEYEDKISAILFAGLGGQESGNAVGDVLSGKVNPSGKLTDTIARKYNDYPSSKNFGNKEFNNYQEDIYVGYRYFETFCKDKVLYPFGFGLSYTDFEFSDFKLSEDDGKIKIDVTVTNIGSCEGKEVAQVYVKAPCGKLGKAKRVLVDFEKTKLLAVNESQILHFSIDKYAFSSFDDEGKTGFKSSYVLENGEYVFYVGNSVRTKNIVGTINIEKTQCLEKLKEVCCVKAPFDRLCASEKDGKIVKKLEKVKVGKRNLAKRIIKNIPDEIGYKGEKGYKLADVKNGKITLDEFISTLTDKELEALTRGHGAMNSSYGVEGNAGAYGGIVKSLNDKGVPPMITTDGPAGVRVKRYASLLPCGTTLASTWNKQLVNELFESHSKQLETFGVDVFLAPGMNIHRNVLCGRNFEYFSEDPVLSGMISTSVIRGIQSGGRSACPKHFACNNQEVRRNTNDSRVSERALREIYLKGFEIAVKNAKPMNIMTSYNKINGVWSHYNYDLVNTVLRKEWGFDGVVITDWWMQKSSSPEFPLIKDNAYRVRARVNVLMPGNMNRVGTKYSSDGTLLKSLGKDGGITRAEIEMNAKDVLSFALRRM